MASVIKSISIDASPDDVWDALRDFGAVHERLAPGFVTESQLDGDDVRVITFFNGAVARERLVGIDERSRRLAYSVVASPLGLTHHNAAAQVIDGDGGGTRFLWSADVLPDSAGSRVAELMDLGIDAIKKAFESPR